MTNAMSRMTTHEENITTHADNMIEELNHMYESIHQNEATDLEPAKIRLHKIMKTIQSQSNGTVELSMWLLAYNELKKIEKKAQKCDQTVVKLSGRQIKHKTPDICGICLNTHVYSASLKTCCGHSFGKKCFQKWTHSKNANEAENKSPCPLCRQTVSSITIYKKKENKKTK